MWRTTLDKVEKLAEKGASLPGYRHRVFWSVLVVLWGWTCADPALPAGLGSARGVTITGTVFDIGGSPVSGAEVSLAPVMDDHEGYSFRLASGRLWARPVATVETAKDGRWALEARAGKLWRLIVEHPGRATVTRRLEPLYEDREMEAVKLRPARELEVRIRGPGGRPVAGARVMASPPVPTGDQWPYSWTATATDAHGRARLRVAQPEPSRIEAAADGLGHVEVEHHGRSAATIDLPAASPLQLQLRLASGEPAAAAVVFRPFKGLTLAKAGRGGRVTLFGVPGSRQIIRVLTPDGSTLDAEVEFPGAGQATEHRTLELVPPRRLEIALATASQLEPLTDAVAWARDDRAVFSDAQGRLTLRIPATERSISVKAIAPGHLLWQRSRLPLSTANGQVVTIGLEPAAGLRGRVVDEDGRPLKGVEIEWVPGKNRARRFPEGRDSRSRPDGTFALSPLPSSARLDLVARKAGFATTHLALDPLRPFERVADLELVLTAGRQASGTVVDEDGHPVAGASIALRRRPTTGGSPSGETRPDAVAVTDASGRFELRDLGPGKFDLLASAATFVPARVPGVDIGGGTEAVDLGSVRLDRGLRIAGTVVDEEGLPLPGARVEISGPRFQFLDDADESSRATSDARGHFAFVDRAAGTYRLRARSSGFLAAESGRLEPPLETPVVLVMRRGIVVLRGRVVDGQGHPVAAASVLADPARGDTKLRASSDEEGDFELVGLAAGKYWLAIEAEGFRRNHSNVMVQVVPGADLTPVEVVLERGALVAGQVRWPDGRPVARESVKVTPATGAGWTLYGRSDGSGLFEIDEVPIGAAVAVASSGSSRTRQEIDVRPGRNMVWFTMRPGVEVSGRVTSGDGEPVASAEVALVPRNGAPPVWSGSDGSFTFADVSPGRYGLRVRHPEYAEYDSALAIEVTTEPLAGLEAQLKRGAVVSGFVDGLEPEVLSTVRVSLDRTARYSAAPDHRGRFRIEHVLPGEYLAEAISDVVLAAGSFELAAETDAIEIELRPVAGVDLSGRVMQDDRGLGGAEIRFRTEGGRRISTDTAGDGSFILPGVPEGGSGRYRLRAQHPGYGMAMAEIDVGPAPLRGVEFGLRPPEEVVLRFSHDDGSKVEKIIVVRADPAGRHEMASNELADADGRVLLSSGPAGLWPDLWVRSWTSAWQHVEVRSPTGEVPVLLTREAELVFRIRDLADAPKQEIVHISLRDDAGRVLPGGGAVHLTPDGVGFEGNLWPGVWTLEGRHTDGRSWRATFTARAGETTEIDVPELSTVIRWPEAGVCVRTRTAQGEPCRTLLPSDGLMIQQALMAYIRSEHAAHIHTKADLKVVRPYVGPPRLVRIAGREVPKIGDFFVYLGDTDGALRLEKTVADNEKGRWGFAFNLRHDGKTWVVTSFGSWRAWR